MGTVFGRPAYTMTLVQKLAKTTGALVVMVVRSPARRGGLPHRVHAAGAVQR